MGDIVNKNLGSNSKFIYKTVGNIVSGGNAFGEVRIVKTMYGIEDVVSDALN